jgi:PAS domain S-box-containing protein
LSPTAAIAYQQKDDVLMDVSITAVKRLQVSLRKRVTWNYGSVVLFIALLCLLSPTQSYAQPEIGAEPGEAQSRALIPPNLKFEHLTTDHGLANNIVWGIVQDNRGFMWFSSLDGLNRYDGYNFKVYKHDPEDPNSLSDNLIRQIYSDRSGILWLTTFAGGLNKFDPETEEFVRYQHDPADPKSLSDNAVRAIYEDRAGDLWLGTLGGLNKFEPATGTFVHYRHDPADPASLADDQVFSIYEDQAGNLWVGTWNGGLDKFDRESESFTHFQHDPDDPNSLSHNSVTAIFQDKAAKLWIGTWGGGLNQFIPETMQFIRYQYDPGDPTSIGSDAVVAIYQDQSDLLWFGTLGGGLNLFDPPTATFIRYQHDEIDPYSLSHNDVTAIYEDAEGTLWLGTRTGGINKYYRRHFDTVQPDPFAASGIRATAGFAVYEDHEGLLWMGHESGLMMLDPKSGSYKNFQHDPNDPHSLSNSTVQAITEDRRGNLWVGTSSGLNKFDRETETFLYYLNDTADSNSLSADLVYAIAEDQAGMLWIGTFGGGLNRFDPETGKFKRYLHNPSDPTSLSANVVETVVEDHSGVIWVGTNGGLNKLNQETGEFTHFTNDPNDPQSLSDDSVLSLLVDDSGTLWVGTSGGLNRFDQKRQSFIRYTESDGLPSNRIDAIVEGEVAAKSEESSLWMTTNRGVTKFGQGSELFRNYDRSDGLEDNFALSLANSKSNSGEIFVGTASGFNVFVPAELQDNPYSPPIVITEIYLANRPIESSVDTDLPQSIMEIDQITLSHSEKVISLEFSGLSYQVPGKNRYRYMLEGFDEDWTEVGADRRFVTYTNLDPGDYTFRVLGSNNDGLWNEEGASITITITPPWWQTTWFRMAVFASLMGLMGLVLVGQGRRRRAREQELEALVTTRTQELAFAQAQIGTLFESSPLAIGTASLDGKILSGNAAMARMFGYSEDELIGANVTDFFQQAGQRKEIIKRLRSEKIVQTQGKQLKRKDGSLFYANISESILERENQEVILGVVDDITDQLAAEQALKEKDEAAAVAAERNRIANELHDSVTQSLYSASLIAEALPKVWTKHPQEARRSLEELRSLTQGAQAEMRTLLLELRPGELADRKLSELLRQLTDAMSARTDLPITVTVVGDCQLPTDVQIAYYRITQEALNNISKHARANRAWVNLRCGQDRVTLRVGDNGRGFDPAISQIHQLGLQIMRERAEAIGADLSITSQPGQGTEVKVVWQVAE